MSNDLAILSYLTLEEDETSSMLIAEEEMEDIYLSLLMELVQRSDDTEKVDLQRLERVTILDGSDNPCSICLEALSTGPVYVARLPCSHFYHEDCIVRWFEKHVTCPLCRHSMV